MDFIPCPFFFDKMASLSRTKKTTANENWPFTQLKPHLQRNCNNHIRPNWPYQNVYFIVNSIVDLLQETVIIHCTAESQIFIWQVSPGKSCHWVPWSSSGKRHTSVILYTLKITNEEIKNLDILSFWEEFQTKQNHFGVGKPDSHGIVVWLQAISEILEYFRSENRTWTYYIWIYSMQLSLFL